MFTLATWLEIISDSGVAVELLVCKKTVALVSGMVMMLPVLSFHK